MTGTVGFLLAAPVFTESSVDVTGTVGFLLAEPVFTESSVDAIVTVLSAFTTYALSLNPTPKAITVTAAKAHFLPSLYIL